MSTYKNSVFFMCQGLHLNAVFTESFGIVNQMTDLFVFAPAPLKFIVSSLKATFTYMYVNIVITHQVLSSSLLGNWA